MRIQLPSINVFRRRQVIGFAAALLALAVACGAFATPTPALTATPEPTPTVAPTGTPTSTPPPVVTDTSALDGATEEAFAVLEELLEELGPRESTTD
jgi:hypothetical protein